MYSDKDSKLSGLDFVSDAEPDFRKIKETAYGLMSTENYRNLYRNALSVTEGEIVEIGPARGASTIALALASKRNPNIKQIISIDTFRESWSLKTWDNIEENIQDLKDHLSAFECCDLVHIMIAGHEDIGVVEKFPISMMFIDADGSLDRDFTKYYHMLLPGALVVVDDCKGILNSYAKSRNTRERTGFTDNMLEDAEDFLDRPAPLGKEYITFGFIRYLICKEYFNAISCTGNTITLQKTETHADILQEDKLGMQSIRQQMKDELIEIRRKTMEFVQPVEAALSIIRRRAQTDSVILMKREFIKDKGRYYPIYGINASGKKAEKIGRYFEDELFTYAAAGELQYKIVKFHVGIHPAQVYALLINSSMQGSALIPAYLMIYLKWKTRKAEAATRRFFKLYRPKLANDKIDRSG